MENSLQRRTTLETLPADITRIILEQLHRGDIPLLFSFSLVSKTCRAQCEPIIFGTVTLRGKHRTKYQTTCRIVNRLQNPMDSLKFHVRHLVIGSYNKNTFLNSDSFTNILHNVQNLQSLRWNSYWEISQSILETLSRHHPLADIHVTNNMRRRFLFDNPFRLDEALLASPQLKFLDTTIMCLEYGHRKTDKGVNEMRVLKDQLIKGGSLKTLRLSFESIQCPSLERIYQVDTERTYEFTNFPFQDGDIFPALEELELRQTERKDGLGYQFPVEHCRMWKSCMDWSHLRSLKLSSAMDPQNVFTELSGFMPQLKVLHFGSRPDPSSLRFFLSSVSALEEVKMQSDGSYQKFMDIVDAILETQAPNLKRAFLECDGSDAKPWHRGQHIEILEKCREITCLETVIERQTAKGAWEWPRTTEWRPRERYLNMNITWAPSYSPPAHSMASYDGAMGFTVENGRLVPWGTG